MSVDPDAGGQYRQSWGRSGSPGPPAHAPRDSASHQCRHFLQNLPSPGVRGPSPHLAGPEFLPETPSQGSPGHTATQTRAPQMCFNIVLPQQESEPQSPASRRTRTKSAFYLFVPHVPGAGWVLGHGGDRSERVIAHVCVSMVTGRTRHRCPAVLSPACVSTGLPGTPLGLVQPRSLRGTQGRRDPTLQHKRTAPSGSEPPPTAARPLPSCWPCSGSAWPPDPPAPTHHQSHIGGYGGRRLCGYSPGANPSSAAC